MSTGSINAKWWYRPAAVAVLAFAVFLVGASVAVIRPRAGEVDRLPEGVTPDRLVEIDVDLFAGMDNGVQLDQNEIRGRNTWIVWTGGNQGFWNWLAKYGFGTNDLLKMLDSRNRGERFATVGVMNEPGFRESTEPDEYGLWLDNRVAPPEPVDEEVFGRASGVVGLRLFRNPDFKGSRWDPERYYTDPNYYNDPQLERPYMVGMSCGFCHVGPNPLNPPADPENPAWENLSSNIGSQYLRTAGVFGNGMDESSLIYQILRAMPDGTLDTSFLATDNILNPSNMNAIFEVGGRLAAAEAADPEEMGEGNMAVPGQEPSMHVPHILKDGADGIGLRGALSRVYVNIGEFHEQWLRNQNILLGGKSQTPFEVTTAQENSPYWRATEGWVDNLAAFFLRSAGAMKLADAPGGEAYLTADDETLDLGRITYANECAACHSSKRPPNGIEPNSEEGKAWFRDAVGQADFLEGNYLSDDARYPVSGIGTNICRAMATNAMRGRVWDNFSSETYKSSPPSGPVQLFNPFTRTEFTYQPYGGGPGYYRTPSLVSIWATAPYFHNNALGVNLRDPSVEGRMAMFDDAMQKLLWPQYRMNEASIWRTTEESSLQIPAPYLPDFLQSFAEDGYLQIGPIPEGTPAKLLANIDLTLDSRALDRQDANKILRLASLLRSLKNALLEIELRDLEGEAAQAVLADLVPELLANNKCPDFIEDKGHYFGTTLEDAEKLALVEYLKTL
ncbi:MAG: hypothetical protein GEU90_10950 [Gemmatimonas sp.]|nr:hypothetical protein [Gemmatimonas sp.]